MGNLQSCDYMGCFYRCFGRPYKRWPSQNERLNSFLKNGLKNTANSVIAKRHRIKEYLDRVINRGSRSLLFNDQFSHKPFESGSQDFRGVNSVSWISDGGSSDASHALYRELDPYNYTSVNESLLPSASSSYASDLYKSDGSFVAVTKLTGSNNQTSTSLCFLPASQLPVIANHEEEVDGMELARLARNMWSTRNPPSRRDGKKQCVSAQPHCNPIAVRMHSTPDPTASMPPESPINVTPIDLDWDHEPGIPTLPTKQNIVKRPTFPAANKQPSGSLRSESQESLHTKLFPVRPRRHPVARLPLTGDTSSTHTTADSQVKRWSYSDKLMSSNASWLHPIPDSAKLTSPPSIRPTDELVDSGFAGMGTSFAEENLCFDARSSDHLLWENELFGDR